MYAGGGALMGTFAQECLCESEAKDHGLVMEETQSKVRQGQLVGIVKRA